MAILPYGSGRPIPLPVAQGGTGAITLTGIVKGNGTSALTAATSGSDYSAGTASLATGILKSTTTTGALSIAVAGDFPTLNQNTSGTAAGLSATLVVGSGGTGQTTYTDGQLLIGNSSGNTLTKATVTAGNGISVTNGNGSITIAQNSGYTLQFSEAATTPSNGTTYYFGARMGNTFSATSGSVRVYIPKKGTVTAVYVFFFNGTANSSAADTSTISFRLNNTTDTTISSSVTNNAAQTAVNNTGLSISVNAGDYFEIKWVTPTWTTSGPQGTTVSGVVFIQPVN